MATTKKPTVSSVPLITSTGAGSAGNTASLAGGAPIVAPKGFRLKLQQMIAGWGQVLPAGSAVPSRGGSLDQATILAQLQGFMGDYTSLDSAEVTLKAARVKEEADLPAAKALLALLKEALIAFYGANSPTLASFGLKPKSKAKPLTADQEAVRVAKLRNTREIRGTTGKVQKASQKSGPISVSAAPAEVPVGPTLAAAGSAAGSTTPVAPDAPAAPAAPTVSK